MTAYRFAARSTTPGEYRLAPGAMELLVSASDVRLGVDRGDGTPGVYSALADYPDESDVRGGVLFASGLRTGRYWPFGQPSDGDDGLMAAADQLVIALNGIAELLGAGSGPAFRAKWEPDPLLELSDAPSTPIVWVVDFAEARQPAYLSSTAQAGLPVGEFELLVVVQQKVAGDRDAAAAQVRALATLTSQIARHCRETILPFGDGSICFQTERTRSRDFEELHTKKLYRAEIGTHWRSAGD
jgi:hypothetical protein